MKIIGIDSGRNGSVAIITDGKVETFDLPYSIENGTDFTNGLKLSTLLLPHLDADMVILEDVPNVRQNDSRTKIKQGTNFGIVLATLQILQFKYEICDPLQWQWLFKLHGKQSHIDKVEELYGIDCDRHDVADAILLATWYIKKIEKDK